MEFNFYDRYQDYSNIELLKIIKQPAAYQTAAVEAAQEILKSREVNSEEIQMVEQYFEDIESAEKDKIERKNIQKEKVTDFFEPVIYPSETVEPNKWVNILLFLIGIQYVWVIYNSIKRLYYYYQGEYYLGYSLGMEIINLLYIPFLFFLLFKRHRWGWILLFTGQLFAFISGISDSYFFFQFQEYYQWDIVSFLLPIVINIAFVFFLWREPIASHFGISKETKKKTALIVTSGTFIFLATMYLMY